MLLYGLVQWLAIVIFTITLLVESSNNRAMSSPFHLYVKTALTFPKERKREREKKEEN